MIQDLVEAIVVGFCGWYLRHHREWERERVRLWKLGLPWALMPDEPDRNRRLGLTRIDMRCQLVIWQWRDSQ